MTIEVTAELKSLDSPATTERCSREATRTERFEGEALSHLDDLYRTARRLLGNTAEAEDIVQETCLLAWKSFDRFEAGTDCRAWLFRIMFNAVRHYRRKWFDRRVTGEAAEILEETVTYTPPIAEEISDQDVLSALDGIPAEFRAVVLLADVQEFSYKEIAEILRIPVGTVMSRLSRGRRLLRAALGDLAQSYGINEPCQQASFQR